MVIILQQFSFSKTQKIVQSPYTIISSSFFPPTNKQLPKHNYAKKLASSDRAWHVVMKEIVYFRHVSLMQVVYQRDSYLLLWLIKK